MNLAVALMSPDGLRPFIVNWEEVALYFVRGVQADAPALSRVQEIRIECFFPVDDATADSFRGRAAAGRSS